MTGRPGHLLCSPATSRIHTTAGHKRTPLPTARRGVNARRADYRAAGVAPPLVSPTPPPKAAPRRPGHALEMTGGCPIGKITGTMVIGFSEFQLSNGDEVLRVCRILQSKMDSPATNKRICCRLHVQTLHFFAGIGACVAIDTGQQCQLLNSSVRPVIPSVINGSDCIRGREQGSTRKHLGSDVGC